MKQFYFLVFFLLVIDSYTDATCPPTFTPGLNGTWCYKAYETPLPFENATSVCKSLNMSGNQISIHSAFENALVKSIITTNQTYWWLGGLALGDETTGFVWKWIDGSPYNYNNYGVSVSAFLSDVLRINANTGKWDDVYRIDSGFDYALPFVCKTRPIEYHQ